jgi:hypothetical protein
LALTTVRAYHSDLGTFLRWYAPHPVEALTAVDLIRYRQHLSEERSLKPASVNRKLEALRRLRAACEQILDTDLARVSPLCYAHIIPNGTYNSEGAIQGGNPAHNTIP